MVRQATYRSLQDRLDVTVSKLESGELGIDEAVTAYEEALKIIKQLETHLQTAENRVVEIAKTYTDAA